MREVAFLRNNKAKWDAFEDVLDDPKKANPDKVAELFIEVTDDLSYARTFYPESKTKIYLNGLASKLHLRIYANKKEQWGRLWDFWKYDIPRNMREAFPQLLFAFAVAVISIFIGVISAADDLDYVRTLMGDGYVNETIENIEKGDPLGIYATDSKMNMFFMIAFNNFGVMMKFFALGILLSAGTVIILFFNAVMLGAFHYLFYHYGQLGASLSTVYIHGAIEIPCMVLSAAAGLCLGNSILFPGTYSRVASLQRGAKRGLIIVVGLTPFILVAAGLESFVTRYYQQSLFFNLTVIFLSLGFVIWYFLIYPIIVTNRDRMREAEEAAAVSGKKKRKRKPTSPFVLVPEQAVQAAETNTQA